MLNLNKLLSQVFNGEKKVFQDSDSPETIKNWDSFQALILFQELEQASNTSFSIDDLKDIKNVGDIKKLLQKYNIEFTL